MTIQELVMKFVWIKKVFLFSLLIISLTGCSGNKQNIDNLSYCVNGWATYHEKIYAVESELRNIGFLNEYIAIKQGIDGAGGGQYWFMLVGIKDSEGVIVHMSDNITQPIVESVQFELAEDLIAEGKRSLELEEYKILALDVNHVPCHFFKYKKGEANFDVSFSGLTNHMVELHDYLLRLSSIAIKLRENVEKDRSDPKVDKSIAEIEKLKNEMKTNYFIEFSN